MHSAQELELGKEEKVCVDEDAEIKRLAQLKRTHYERERKAAAERLGIRAAILDKLVQAERPDDENKQGRAISLPEPELWPESVDGTALLDGLAEAIGRYVVMPEHSRDTAALWVVHSYLLDCFLVSPRLAVCSPAKQCGKTTLLDVLGCLVLKPLPTANVTASAIFRVIEGHRPTALVDEADTFLRNNDELRGIINSGHRRGGAVLRAVGDDFEPRAFSTYSACAIALIGKLPDTLHDRSVVIDLKRRLPSEEITAFRLDRTDHLEALARQAARWARDHAESIAGADPDMPDGIYNRRADNWRPLLAIADATGGHWPERARKAVEQSNETGGDMSRIALLLADIRKIFKELNTDKIFSLGLVEALRAIEGRPWAEYHDDKPISQNQLATALKPVGIAPEIIRINEDRARGYRREQFNEAFERYRPSEGIPDRDTVTKPDEMGTSDIFQGVTPESDVTVPKSQKSNNDWLCHGVTVQKGGNGAFRTGTCAQCHGAPDGKETQYSPGVWLHPECARFYFAAIGDNPPRDSEPDALVNRVREGKADLIAAFGRRDRQRAENSVRKPAERRLKKPPLECSVVEWLNEHPAASPADRCAWCGRPETADAAVLPYGTEPGTHVWLHTECWEPWQRKRRTEAVKSLALMGISPPPGDVQGLTPVPTRREFITQPEVRASHLEQQCSARRGLVQETEGGALLHYCEKCGALAPFGYGVSLRRGRLGRWYCAAHRPQGGAP